MLPPSAPLQNALSKIALGILGCEVALGIGTYWAGSGVREWYPTLIKPPWAPGATAFGPLWMLLWALMGIALGLVWAKPGRSSREKRAMLWFWGQIALAAAWSAMFFGLRSPGWAYAIVILLWLSAAATLWLFSKISRAAGWLVAPFLAYVTFASALNFAILSLNVLKPKVQQMDVDPRNGPADKKPGATLR